MKYCNECGAKNEPSASNCSECGAVLAQETQKKSGISTKAIIAVVAILVVGAAAVFGGMQLFGKKNDVNPLANVEAQMEMMKGSDVALRMSLELGEDASNDPNMAMMASIFKDAYVTITSKHNLDATKMAFGFDVNAMGQSFVNGEAIVDENGILVNIPMIYQAPLYFDWEKLGSLMEAEGSADFSITYEDVKAYLAVLDVQNSEAYKAIDMNELSEKMINNMGITLTETGKEKIKVTVDGSQKDIDTTVFEVKYNMEDMMKSSQKIVKDIYGDPKMVAFMKERAAFIINVAEERGHLQGEELLQAKLMLEGTAFEDAINEMIAELDTQYETGNMSSADIDQVNEIFGGMKTIIYVDSDNVTRKQVMSMAMPAEAGIDATIVMEMVVNDYGKNVQVPSANADNAVDVLSLSEEEQMQLMMNIQMNIESFTTMFGMGF